MGRWTAGILIAAVGLSACSTNNTVLSPDGGSGVVAPPVGLDVRYYDRSVVVTWELAAGSLNHPSENASAIPAFTCCDPS